MQTFLAEAYMPRSTLPELEAAAERLAGACLAVSRPRRRVRHLRALHVPDDELCLHLFEASTCELVAEASALAGIRHVRIVETVSAGGRL